MIIGGTRSESVIPTLKAIITFVYNICINVVLKPV